MTAMTFTQWAREALRHRLVAMQRPARPVVEDEEPEPPKRRESGTQLKAVRLMGEGYEVGFLISGYDPNR